MNIADLPVPAAPRYADAAPADGGHPCRGGRCVSHAPTAPIIDWCRLGRTVRSATTATASGILQCAGCVAAAAPHVVAFYATALAVRTIAATISEDCLILVKMDPLSGGRVCTLAALSAAAYGVDVLGKRRASRGLSTALTGALSRVMRLGIVITVTSSVVGYTVVRFPTYVLGIRWSGNCLKAYNDGFLNGVALGATAAAVVAAGAILFHSGSPIVARLRHSLARTIDADTAALEPSGSHDTPARDPPAGSDCPPLPFLYTDADEPRVSLESESVVHQWST